MGDEIPEKYCPVEGLLLRTGGPGRSFCVCFSWVLCWVLVGSCVGVGFELFFSFPPMGFFYGALPSIIPHM